MRQGYYKYGAILFVTYMICVSLCFPGNGTVIHQALRSMESKWTTHSAQTTLQICVSVPRREIFEDPDYFSYQSCYFIHPILCRSGDGLYEVYDINNG